MTSGKTLARIFMGLSVLLASAFCLGQSFPTDEQLRRLAVTISLDDRIKDIQVISQESFRSQVLNPAIRAANQQMKGQGLKANEQAELVEKLSSVRVRMDHAALKALLLQPYQRLTADDVEEVIAFFGSPAGRRLNLITAEFQRNAMNAGLATLLQEPWNSAMQETQRIVDQYASRAK